MNIIDKFKKNSYSNMYSIFVETFKICPFKKLEGKEKLPESLCFKKYIRCLTVRLLS